MANSNDDSWTGGWVAEKLETRDGIDSVQIKSANVIDVTLSTGRVVRVATTAVKEISVGYLHARIGNHHVDFVINVPANAKIEEDVFKYAVDSHFAVGGMGDFLRAIRLDDLSSYLPPQVAFVLRGLRQHSAVESIKQIGRNLYRIKGKLWPTLIMIDLNDYELTAATLRTALDEYEFNFILASNPNVGPTSAAIEVAKHADKKMLLWKELLAALNKPWN